MKVRIWAAMAGMALATAISGGAAHAATYLLTVDGCGTGTAGCLGSNTEIGQITVLQNGSKLDFTIALDNGALFNANGNDQHHAFVFDLNPGAAGLGVLTFSNYTTLNSSGHQVATSDFAAPTVTNKKTGVTSLDPGPFNEPPLGKGVWSNAIDYVGSAGQGHTPSNFSFELSNSLNNLSLSMLTFASSYNGQNIEFAADVYANGKTGNVGAIYDDAGDVPEPAAWALMIMGVFGVGATLRQRRRQALTTA